MSVKLCDASIADAINHIIATADRLRANNPDKSEITFPVCNPTPGFHTSALGRYSGIMGADGKTVFTVTVESDNLYLAFRCERQPA